MKRLHVQITSLGVAIFALTALAGCGSMQSAEPGDPLQNLNRSFYQFNDGLDRKVFRPLAQSYANVTPNEVRASVTNFFDNVGYLNVIFNDVLQGKFEYFLKDSGRFFVNSTIGLGGLMDPASSIGWQRRNEDLGQTFGVWGAGEGAYLVLPGLGPNTLRDAPDRVSSLFLNPLFYLASSITVPLSVLNIVNSRANLLEASRILDEAALDPYSFVREAYRQRRQYLIYDGDPPSASFDAFIDEEPGEPPGVLKVY